jgi:hypothetical protein
MTAPPHTASRCDPTDLLPLLSPGQVVGLYQGTQWIDWSGPTPEVVVLTPDVPDRVWRVERQRYHFVFDPGGGSLCPGGFLECLSGVSRGVALVSARLGGLLQRAARIVAPPAYPQRTSGGFRSRSSGAVLVFRETTLRVAERAQVLDSAVISIAVPDPARAISVLGLSFPALQAERFLLHLSLRGHHSEEVLGRLREEGVSVRGSAVWYRLLQTCPLRDRDF